VPLDLSADGISYVLKTKGIILLASTTKSKRQIPDMQHHLGDARDILDKCMRIFARLKFQGGDCGDTSGFRTVLRGPHKTELGLDGARDSDWDGSARATSSKLRRCRKTLRLWQKGLREIDFVGILCCQFIGGIPQELSEAFRHPGAGVFRSFTASDAGLSKSFLERAGGTEAARFAGSRLPLGGLGHWRPGGSGPP